MKVNLKIKLIGEEYLNLKVQGIKKDNTIKYLENGLIVLITIFDDKISIKRSNSDYQVIINLDKKKDTLSTYEFVGGSKTFYLDTKTSELILTDNKICAKYNLEGNDFEFTLEVMK